MVDGRRLELPTSALRTNGGSGRIWLSGHDVNGACPRTRLDAGRRVFAPVSARSCTPVVHKLATKSGSVEPLFAGYTLGMKTAVSIPDEVFEKVERLARKAGRSRSEVFSAALSEYIARHAPDEVTEAMDRVCADIGDGDAFVTAAGRQVLEHTEW
jgi:antitoxin MazE6